MARELAVIVSIRRRQQSMLSVACSPSLTSCGPSGFVLPPIADQVYARARDARRVGDRSLRHRDRSERARATARHRSKVNALRIEPACSGSWHDNASCWRTIRPRGTRIVSQPVFAIAAILTSAIARPRVFADALGRAGAVSCRLARGPPQGGAIPTGCPPPMAARPRGKGWAIGTSGGLAESSCRRARIRRARARLCPHGSSSAADTVAIGRAAHAAWRAPRDRDASRAPARSSCPSRPRVSLHAHATASTCMSKHGSPPRCSDGPGSPSPCNHSVRFSRPGCPCSSSLTAVRAAGFSIPP